MLSEQTAEDCKFFATHFAANCKACLLFKLLGPQQAESGRACCGEVGVADPGSACLRSCQSSGSTSLVQDDGEGALRFTSVDIQTPDDFPSSGSSFELLGLPGVAGEAHGSSQGGTEFERYDIFQVVQSDGKGKKGFERAFAVHVMSLASSCIRPGIGFKSHQAP